MKAAIAKAILVLATLAASVTAFAQAERTNPAPRLTTNEVEIVEALRPGALAIDDPVAVFAYVLGQLPDRVQVYPTENYYYFRFIHNGAAYTGNIKLAAANRDSGEVNFAYGEPPSDWNENPPGRHTALGAAQGVTVEKLVRHRRS